MKKLLSLLLFLFSATALAAVTPQQSTRFAYADLLVWQVREGGADHWATVISPSGAEQTVKPVDAPFPWDEGVRIGIGQQFSQDNDIVFILTHFNSTANKQALGIVYSSYLANYFANNTSGVDFGPSYNAANIRWQIFYNTIDLDLGHHFYLDRILQLRPHIGIKAASINQNIYTLWLNPTTTTDFTSATENLKNHFWGIGPTIGVDTTWPVYANERWSFNLIGNFLTGLLWGTWNFNDVYQNDKPVMITSNVNRVEGLSPMLNGLLALEWVKHFTQAEISVRLGYEGQVWFNQIQFYSLDTGRANRSLSLQGGNLTFKLAC